MMGIGRIVSADKARSPVRAIRSAAEALNKGDIDGYLGHFVPDCPRWVPGLPEPLSLKDIGDNFRLMAAAFDPLRLDDDALFGDHTFVCARWRLRGVHVADYLGFPPYGHSIDVETCEVYQVENGFVISSWVYGDLSQLFQQIAPSKSETNAP